MIYYVFGFFGKYAVNAKNTILEVLVASVLELMI